MHVCGTAVRTARSPFVRQSESYCLHSEAKFEAMPCSASACMVQLGALPNHST